MYDRDGDVQDTDGTKVSNADTYRVDSHRKMVGFYFGFI